MKETLKKTYDLIPFKKNIFSILKFIWTPKESIYKHLHFKGIFNVKLNNNSFFIEHYGFQIENEIFWSGLREGHEKISMQLWVELCKNSSTIIDVGANTGIYSLVAKTVNANSLVFGFEPVKRVFEKYKKNCELNNYDIQCIETALSNFDGEAIIYDTPTEHTYSVTVNRNMAVGGIKTIETKIKTTKLSTFIKENNIENINLIKIDVETHEAEVLEGMEEFLNKFQPTMLIEILNDEVGAKVQTLVKDIDYLFYNIDEISEPKRVNNITKSAFFNYLICKEDVAIKLNLSI